MSEPEAVTRARTWIPLHRNNPYQAEAAKIMNRLLAAYDELRGEVERLADDEVEQAAQAMYWDAFCLAARNAGLHPDPWELLNAPTKESWRACAHAAIAAFLAERRGSE